MQGLGCQKGNKFSDDNMFFCSVSSAVLVWDRRHISGVEKQKLLGGGQNYYLLIILKNNNNLGKMYTYTYLQKKDNHYKQSHTIKH